MLETSKKLKFKTTSKRSVLVLLIYWGSLITISAQFISTPEIVELFSMNMLQMDINPVLQLNNKNQINWILSNGNASLVSQEGSNNQALIEQIKGTGNIAKVVQKNRNNRIDYEYADKRVCEIYQYKNKNQAEVKQTGNQSKTRIAQQGDKNDISVVQHTALGSCINYMRYGNELTVSQKGYNNSATVAQSYSQ